MTINGGLAAAFFAQICPQKARLPGALILNMYDIVLTQNSNIATVQEMICGMGSDKNSTSSLNIVQSQFQSL
jgi:hypothetical protein